MNTNVNYFRYNMEALAGINNVLNLILCRKCDNVGDMYLMGHHSGPFHNQLVKQDKILNVDINRWYYDDLHGIFHGFCTLYIAYLCNKIDTNGLKRSLTTIKDVFATQKIKPIFSCLFHDFARAVDNIKKNHDCEWLCYKYNSM